jgi:hypothetical protein
LSSYWKTLKQKKIWQKLPDLTLGTSSNLANSFLGCDQIWPQFQESVKENSPFNFVLGTISHHLARENTKAGPEPNSMSQRL